MINDDYKKWKLTTESFSLVTSCSTSDMKYGRIPRRSTMFIAPFTNLRDFNIIFCDSSYFQSACWQQKQSTNFATAKFWEKKVLFVLTWTCVGRRWTWRRTQRRTNRRKPLQQSQRNIPPLKVVLIKRVPLTIFWLIWLLSIVMIKFDSSPAFRKINQRKRLFISIFNQKHKDFLIYSSPKESFKCLKVWFLWNNSIVFFPSNCWRLGTKTRRILWRCKQSSKLK